MGIETDTLALYLDDIRSHGWAILTRGQEYELGTLAIAGDAAAQHELVVRNLRLAIAFAKECHRRGFSMPMGELISRSNEGLIQASRRFDPARGVRFSTYARWWMCQAVYRHWQDAAPLEASSLDVAVSGGDDAAALEDPPDVAVNVEVDAIEQVEYATLHEAIHRLPQREQVVIMLVFGLGRRAPMALRKVGCELGISHERVRQLRDQALGRLRGGLVAEAG